MKRSGLVSGADPAVLALQLVMPDGALGVQCSCCGEYHDIVLSHMDADGTALHIRPTKDGGGFLCEWCAVRICKCTKNNMKWQLDKPQKGLAGRPRHKCTSWLGTCRGGGTFEGWDAVEQVAGTRTASNCRTCIEKLHQGLPMHEPRPLTPLTPASSFGSGCDQPAISAAALVLPEVTGGGWDRSDKQALFQVDKETVLELGIMACTSLASMGKMIPIVGSMLHGIASNAKQILEVAQAVSYNKSKADSLLRRTALATQYVEGVLLDLQREAFEHFSSNQSRLLGTYLEELERAMVKARDLLLRWKAEGNAVSALKLVSRAVLNRMDIQDLKDVDNTMSKCMSDIGAFLTGLIAMHQIDFRREVLAALAAAEDVNPEKQQQANMSDVATLQADLLQVVGGVDELKRVLAEDRALAEEWQQQVLPQLRGMGVIINRIDAVVNETLTDVREIKDVVHNISDQMAEGNKHMGGMQLQLEEVNKQLKELKQWFKKNGHSQNGRSRQMPRLLISADSVKIDTTDRVVGAGSFAEVYKAKWRGLDVAVKRLRFEGVEKEEAEQVYIEALILNHLSHPCIVPFYGMIDEGSPMSNLGSRLLKGALVMELCDCSLQNLLDQGRIELSVAVNIAWQVAQGLHYLHNEAPIRVVHGDLKPQNILIKGNVMTSMQVKICDFGLSNPTHMSSLIASFQPTTQYSSGVGGSLLWQPPEVLAAAIEGRNIDMLPPRDIYAFGMILYELLTRKRPFAELGRISDLNMFRRKVIGEKNRPGARPTGLEQWQQQLQQPQLEQESGGTSSDFAHKLVELVQQCWQGDPAKRPTALQVLEMMEQIDQLCHGC
eukprot:GHRR01001367.1.p1 GENE.GHRR01001367.1~~GHRR01001367.1.p1  ORF type:complete len:833 (+),score=291.77 GHRR01001367.1:1250-3748(+)